MDKKFPFKNNLVPVVHSINELERILIEFTNHKFCLFISKRDMERWQIARSRRFMNRVLPGLIYLPVNVDNTSLLENIYGFSKSSSQIIGLNHTAPYKGNMYLKNMFKDLNNCPYIIDFIVKNDKGQFVPYNVNQLSFFKWVEDIVSLENKTIIIVGIGGTGKMISTKVVSKCIQKVILVDINDKNEFVVELKKINNNLDISYVESLEKLDNLKNNNIVIINAAGTGVIDDELKKIFNNSNFKSKNNYYFDLTNFEKLEIVEYAKLKGWSAYTAFKMQTINDHIILDKLSRHIGECCLSIDEFEKEIHAVNQEIYSEEK